MWGQEVEDSTSLGATACFATMFTAVPGEELGPEMPALSNGSKADVNDVVTTSEGINSRVKRDWERRKGEEKGWSEKLTASRCTTCLTTTE